MSDKITVGDIKNSVAVAIGDGATAIANIIMPDTRPKAAFHIPALAAHFTGRIEHINAIANAFASSSSSSSVVVTQAISGLGGVGKTQVALAYAHVYRRAYDIVWLLTADATEALDNGLRQLGLTLELPVAQLDAAAMRLKVLSRLSESGERALLIYDNADKIMPRDLRPYLPSGCHALITSRRDDSQWGGMAQPLTLGTFTVEEALAFWGRRMGVETETETETASPVISTEGRNLAALAKALGHLPLALEQAAAFMIAEQMGAADYLQTFTEQREALWAREEPPDMYHATVATTWKMAFDHAQKTAGAAELLNLLAFFAPEAIPLDAVWAGAERLPEPLAAVAADKWKRRDSLKALRTYSLLTVEEGKAAIHRLAQDVARRRLGEDGRLWAEAVLDLLYEVYNFDNNDMSTWAASGELMPHLTAAVRLADDVGAESKHAGYLNNEAGFYLMQYGEYGAARPYYDRALSIWEKQLGPDHPDVASSLNNLGALLRAMGAYGEALPYYDRALAIKEKTLGSDHPSIATSLNNLGLLLKTMGAYGAARPYYDRALAILEKEPGPNHPNVAATNNNLGLLLKTMGAYGEARPYYDRALAILEKEPGPNHPNVAATNNNLGALLQAMGAYGEARPYYDRALAIREKQLGPDHPDVASSLNNLGELLRAMGAYGEARPYYDRALSIWEKQLGPDHPNVATLNNNLGLLLEAMGAYEEARTYYDRALAITEKQLGPNHPTTAIRLNNLAVLAYDEGDRREAARLMRRALAIWEKTVGHNHPHTQTARQSLAAIEAAL